MNNKTALITGAAKRIGAAIARQLHNEGLDIVIHHNTSGEDAKSLVDFLNAIRPDSAITLQANLQNPKTYSDIIQTAYKFNNRLDVLINNASTFTPSPIDTLGEKDWDSLININLKAPLFLAKSAKQYLKQNNGCIINITDIHAERPLAEHCIYSTAKAGLVMLTKSLAKELAPEIRVNAISPGAISWPENMDEDTQNAILSKVALKKTGAAEDIAKAASFLIQKADYITGQVISVDGGRMLDS